MSQKLKDLLGIDSGEDVSSDAKKWSKYPKAPQGVAMKVDEETKTLVIDIEAGMPFTQVTMDGGEIISAKNSDGTDSDMFKP